MNFSLLAPLAALHYNYHFVLPLYSFNLTLGVSTESKWYFTLICLNVKMYIECVNQQLSGTKEYFI